MQQKGLHILAVLIWTIGALSLSGCAARRTHPAEPAGMNASAGTDPLVVVALRHARHDLHALRAVERATGAVFRVYHDSVSAGTGRAAPAELWRVYRHVAWLMAADPARVDWAAVAFVADPDYTPPRTDREVRWHLETDSTGLLTAESARRLVPFIAHEQAHSVHSTLVAEVPRWFSEGVATWVELRTAEALAPELAEELRAEYGESADTAPANLRGWGGVSVRREAILRQVSPEQRERMEQDPTYMPPGPFRFQAGDYITDLDNEKARYAAALVLFESMERQAGMEALQVWLRTIWERGGVWRTAELAALAAALTGVDLENYLR